MKIGSNKLKVAEVTALVSERLVRVQVLKQQIEWNECRPMKTKHNTPQLSTQTHILTWQRTIRKSEKRIARTVQIGHVFIHSVQWACAQKAQSAMCIAHSQQDNHMKTLLFHCKSTTSSSSTCHLKIHEKKQQKNVHQELQKKRI